MSFVRIFWVILAHPLSKGRERKDFFVWVIHSQHWTLLQVTVNQETLNDLLSFLIGCVKTCKKWTLLNILRALGSTLYENGSLCGQVFIAMYS